MSTRIARLLVPTVLALCSACFDPDADRELGTAESAVYTATVTASPSLVELGQKVTCSWTSAPEHSIYDYVTLARVGSADNAYLTYQYVGNAGQTSGDLLFTIPLTAALDFGPFECRYFSGGAKLATSNSITGYADYSLTDTPKRVELGQTASVTWHAPLAHSPYDYVTLAKVGSADNAYLTYQYVGHAGEVSGTLTFTVPLTQALDPGPYEFRYFFSLKRATSASFVGYADYTVTANGPCLTGQPFDASWTAPLAHSPYDIVGLFTASGSVVTYRYVGNAGLGAGTVTMSGPAPGGYELRYMFGSKVTAVTGVSCELP